MSIVKINAIEVPAERADMMAQRFAARAGEVGKSEGFEEFQLLRPSDDRTTWLVYTRWRDEEAFEAWRSSRAFGGAHGAGGAQGQHGAEGAQGQHGAEGAQGQHGAEGAQGQHGAEGAQGQHGNQGGHGGQPAQGGPVATGSELWSFLVEQREAAPSVAG